MIPTIHTLKIREPYFSLVCSWRKTFEIRKNDRDFKPGDIVILLKWNPDTKSHEPGYILARILYVLKDTEFPGLAPGYCAAVAHSKSGA